MFVRRREYTEKVLIRKNTFACIYICMGSFFFNGEGSRVVRFTDVQNLVWLKSIINFYSG